MKTRSTIKARNLPFTVTTTKDGIKVNKRFQDPKEAWRHMMMTGGSLHMAFRAGV